jgi:hypothetical protein
VAAQLPQEAEDVLLATADEVGLADPDGGFVGECAEHEPGPELGQLAPEESELGVPAGDLPFALAVCDAEGVVEVAFEGEGGPEFDVDLIGERRTWWRKGNSGGSDSRLCSIFSMQAVASSV